MSLYFILFGGLLYSEVFPAPDKFRFTTEPTSQSISSGQTATILCQATGRNNDISYKWFKHKVGFTVPPDTSGLKSEEIAGQSGTSLTVNADDIADKNMFQCQALARSEIIYSNVGTISITIPDSIQFDAVGVSKTFTKSTDSRDTSSGDNQDVFAYIIRCNENVADISSKITNGKPFNISWYKDSDTNRVEDTYSNMWTYYGDYKSKSDGLHIGLTDFTDYQYQYELYKFDLVIYNIRKSTDGGSYKCKAVSQGSEFILGTTQLTVKIDQSSDNFTIDTEELAVGYHVQAVDKSGLIKKLPNVGDTVTLMCGAVCYKSDKTKVRYTWKDSSETVLQTSTSVKYTVPHTAEGSYTYKCSINKDCSKDGKFVSRSISFTVNKREISSKFSFTTFSSEYIWYDTSFENNPNDLIIDCTGEDNLGDSSMYLKYIYLNGKPIISNKLYTTPKLRNNSGAYQCAFSLASAGSNNMWVQKTTEVLIASPASASILFPTSTSKKEGKSSTFTCEVGGYPITGVTINGPNYLSLSCPGKRGDFDCTKSGDTTYELSIKSFSLSKSGTYTCEVDTKYWKDASNSVPKHAEASVKYTMPSTTILTASINPATIGTEVTLTCIVKGYPEPSRPLLTRTDNSNSLKLSCSGISEKICTHAFTNIQYSDNGKYKCYGKNIIDSVEKSSTGSLGLTVNGDVDVTLSLTPDKTDFDLSEKVTFTCKVEGHPLPHYMKFKNTATDIKTYDGSDTSGITINTYDIVYTHIVDSLKLADASTYTCDGKNNNGAVKTDDATKTIVVYKTVSVTLTVSNKKVDKGSSITLTCIAIGGKKPYEVELKHGSTMLARNSESSFCTETDSLTLKCEHTITSIAKKPYDVELKHDSTMLAKNSEKSFCTETDSFTLKCEHTITSKGKKPYEIELKHGSTNLAKNSESSFCTETDSSTLKCEHTITSIGYNHNGVYTCVGKNRIQNDVSKQNNASVDVEISKSVSVSLTPSSLQKVNYGRLFTITCTVDGGLAPHKVTLSKPDNMVKTWLRSDSTNGDLSCTGENIVACRYQNIFVYSDKGTFTCTGYNKLPGSNDEKTAIKTANIAIIKNITVTITKNPSTTEVDFGKTLKITCEVEGGRAPYYLRMTHTDPVSTETELIVYNTDGSKTSDRVIVGDHKLTYVHFISSTDYNDNGNYVCLGKHRAGGITIRTDVKTLNVIVVKSVVSSIKAPSTFDKGASSTITCYAEGYRPPKYIALTKGGITIKVWGDPNSNTQSCNKLNFYSYQCTYLIQTADYVDGGNYICTARNYAKDNNVVIRNSTKTIEISRAVDVSLDPSSTKEVTYGIGKIILTCTIEGGLPPHKVEVKDPKNMNYLWDRNGTYNTLTCSPISTNKFKCTLNIDTDSYNNDGTFTCTGYNYLPGNATIAKIHSQTVDIVIVKDLTVSVVTDPSTTEVDFGKTLKITCEVEGGRAPYYLRMTHTDPANTETELIVYNTDGSKTPGEIIVGDHKLLYIHTISSTNYLNNGNYNCQWKNKASKFTTTDASKTVEIVIVKDIEIKAVSSLENDFGATVTIKFKVEGGRSPNSVQLSHPNHQNLIDWQVGKPACTGKYKLECTKVITKLNYSYDGLYTITAKNQARSAVKNSTKFTITVYKDVSATITPSSNKDIIYKQTTIIICRVDGGSKPSQVDLSLPILGPKIWKRDQTGTGLDCSGEHKVTCTYQLIPEYDSDGIYKCKGYNTIRDGLVKTDESFPVTLTTIRDTVIANISAPKTDILIHEYIAITCIIVGKPLIKESEVVWLHKTIEDLNRFTKNSKTGNDEFTLQSILNSGALELKPGYSGDFTCSAGGNTKSININIAERNYLEDPMITYDTMGQNVNKDSYVIIYCEVEGFPSKRATLTVTLSDKNLKPIDVDIKYAFQTKQTLNFTHKAGCMDKAYVCTVKTFNNDGEELESRVRQVGAPVIEGCSDYTTQNIIISFGVLVPALFIFIILLVVYLMKIRKNKPTFTTENPENMKLNRIYKDVVLENVGKNNDDLYNDVVITETPILAENAVEYDYARTSDMGPRNVGPRTAVPRTTKSGTPENLNPVYSNHEVSDK